MDLKDNRVKMMNEVLNGIKVSFFHFGMHSTYVMEIQYKIYDVLYYKKIKGFK